MSFVAASMEHIKARLLVQYHDPQLHGSSSVLTITTSASAAPQKLYGPITLLSHILTTHDLRGLYHGLLSTLLFRSRFFVFWASYSNLAKAADHDRSDHGGYGERAAADAMDG
ncbi:hypothetical protein BDZ91DRAFT_793601 [Kalaharituber pfeilii]|nr:hypothetical protein BDZ91DRAFT_793601 [Kalaharituber pfeilii]